MAGARIPSFLDVPAVSPARDPGLSVDANDFGYQTGAALSDLGGVLRQIGAERQDRANAVWTSKALATARSAVTQKFLSAKDAAQPGAPAFTQTFMPEVETIIAQAVKNAPNDRVAAALQDRLSLVQEWALTSAAEFESTESSVHRRFEIGQTNDIGGATLLADPSLFPQLLEEGNAAIEGSLSPREWDEAKSKLALQYATTALTAKKQIDAEGTLEELQAGMWAPYLNGTDGAWIENIQGEIDQQNSQYWTDLERRDRQAERQLKERGDALAREGYAMFDRGELTNGWIEENAASMAPSEVNAFYKMQRESLEPGADYDEPRAVADIEAGIGTEDMKSSILGAYQANLIKTETFRSMMSRNDAALTDTQPASPPKQGRALIGATLDPGALTGYGETAYRAAQAQALVEFDLWVGANKGATRAETLDEAQAIIKRYQVLKFEDMALATGVPRFYTGNRDKLKAGDIDGLDDAGAETLRAMKAGEITREQAEQELRKIDSWRTILAKSAAGVK